MLYLLMVFFATAAFCKVMNDRETRQRNLRDLLIFGNEKRVELWKLAQKEGWLDEKFSLKAPRYVLFPAIHRTLLGKVYGILLDQGWMRKEYENGNHISDAAIKEVRNIVTRFDSEEIMLVCVAVSKWPEHSQKKFWNGVEEKNPQLVNLITASFDGTETSETVGGCIFNKSLPARLASAHKFACF